MLLRSIRSIKGLKGKTVLLRADFNVPVTGGRVDATEDFRLERVMPTIAFLLKRGARIIIMSHRGRPEGKVREDLRLEPVAKRLRQLLQNQKSKIKNQNDNVEFKTDLLKLFPSYSIVQGVTLLENLRFDPREEANDARFAKELAALGDLYVNDAFAVSHRKNASVHAITKYLPSYAGLLMEEEVSALSAILRRPLRPLLVIIGGAKISTKIGLIKKFLRHADAVALGGALANTALKARGYNVGASLVDAMTPADARTLRAAERLVLPRDVIVARSPKARSRVAACDAVRDDEMIFDLGPKTVAHFARLVAGASMIVWNGPLGLFETRKFAKNTFAVFSAVRNNKKAYTVIGGGETVAAFRQFQKTLHFALRASHLFLSTGGGAMLEFLERGTLPGIDVLQR